MKLPPWLVLVIIVAACFGTIWAAAAPKHKGTVKVPARIHVSGNLEGELEPCG
jgi:hypothetical protein